MLNRRPIALLSALLLLVAVLSTTLWVHGADIATAGGGVGPCGTSVCIGASTPPGGGGGGSGGGGGGGGPIQVCSHAGVTVPCSTAFGEYDQVTGCYYALLQPQPPAGDPDWRGHQPGDGAVYLRTCPYGGNVGQGSIWLLAPPAAPPAYDPLTLAHQAADVIPRAAATISTAPSATSGRTALVGAPIWLWINKTDYSYATRGAALSKSVTVPGLTVTAYVYVTGVEWTMGDGGHSPHCGAGTVYHPSDGAHASPDCGYTYAKPSVGVPGQLYAITAILRWSATWFATDSGGNVIQSGTFALSPIGTPATTLKVSELQVLN